MNSYPLTSLVEVTMGLNLVNLDSLTRKYMVEEINLDIQKGTLYLSKRLTPQGIDQYPNILIDSAKLGNDATFEKSLSVTGIITNFETRMGKMVKVPVTAAATLAEGEFNRFYIRAVCRRAIDEGIANVEIYRAKYVENPRPESTMAIGRNVDPKLLLDDIRNNPGKSVYIPSGPNSGLSVMY